MQEAVFPPPAAEPVLPNQRIENQATVQATMDAGLGSQFGMLFFDHEALAFLTSHEINLRFPCMRTITVSPYDEERNIDRLIPC